MEGKKKKKKRAVGSSDRERGEERDGDIPENLNQVWEEEEAVSDSGSSLLGARGEVPKRCLESPAREGGRGGGEEEY